MNGGRLFSYFAANRDTLEVVSDWNLPMPPRWSRKPDRKDPDYRRLDDRMNFAVHVAIFAVSNSGLWFFNFLQGQPWSWAGLVSESWGAVLLLHAIFIFAIARYSDPSPAASNQTSGVGFTPKKREEAPKSTK